ncbi:uncharacterized protein METZ01_LOCUS508450, partial [marine metagenome]
INVPKNTLDGNPTLAKLEASNSVTYNLMITSPRAFGNTNSRSDQNNRNLYQQNHP